ncbi:hypothetical protein K439DRAFT_916087 [Ramaria rubella]|nr:hypothetical protein K439DRAFT_916087 [Ramaria rubella]
MMSLTQEQVLLEQETYFVHAYLEVALLALYIYDYTLCLSQEVQFMWLAKFRLSTPLYFVTRYLPVAKLLFSVIPNNISQSKYA